MRFDHWSFWSSLVLKNELKSQALVPWLVLVNNLCYIQQPFNWVVFLKWSSTKETRQIILFAFAFVMGTKCFTSSEVSCAGKWITKTLGLKMKAIPCLCSFLFFSCKQRTCETLWRPFFPAPLTLIAFLWTARKTAASVLMMWRQRRDRDPRLTTLQGWSTENVAHHQMLEWRPEGTCKSPRAHDDVSFSRRTGN